MIFEYEGLDTGRKPGQTFSFSQDPDKKQNTGGAGKNSIFSDVLNTNIVNRLNNRQQHPKRKTLIHQSGDSIILTDQDSKDLQQDHSNSETTV